MDDESSVSTAESALEFPTGTEKELLRIKGTQLSLMARDESVLVQAGEFAVRVIKQSFSPLAVAICMVGDQHWPVAKDSPVFKVGFHRYAFALPGLLYGLTLPKTSSEELLKRLEGLLQKFCAYTDYSATDSDSDDVIRGSGVDGIDSETDFWSSASPEIEKLLQKMVSGIRRQREISGDTNHEMSKKAQKAIRMSAVTKLVSKSLLRGAINFNFHVDIRGPPFTPAADEDDGESRAFASLVAFSDVIDAVETTGRSILEAGNDVPESQVPAGSRVWYFNRTGLKLLLRAVVASAVLHVRRNSGKRPAKEQELLAGKRSFPVREVTGNSLCSSKDTYQQSEKAIK